MLSIAALAGKLGTESSIASSVDNNTHLGLFFLLFHVPAGLKVMRVTQDNAATNTEPIPNSDQLDETDTIYSLRD